MIFMKKVINTTKAPSAIGPYSQAILVNNTLYISGQIPLNPTTLELYEDIRIATHQVMKNLHSILDTANMNFSNVVKSTIFMKEMNHFEIMNEIYSSYFTENFPARETVQVSVLPKNACIEISMIAVAI